MGKLAWGLALLMAAGVGGWFLSNYLVLLFLGVHDTPPTWNAWWQYV